MKTIYLIGSIVFIVLALSFFVGSLSFEQPGSKTFPQATSTLVIILAVIYAVKHLRQPESLQKEFQDSRPKAVLYTVLSTLGYLLVILGVGFFIATPIYIFVLMRILGIEKKHLLIAVSIGATIIIYLAFVLIFHVPIPTGIVFSQ